MASMFNDFLMADISGLKNSLEGIDYFHLFLLLNGPRFCLKYTLNMAWHAYAMIPFKDPEFHRYFISDAKLAALGWKERTAWEDGLLQTIRWYTENDINTYWKPENIEKALQPHPVL